MICKRVFGLLTGAVVEFLGPIPFYALS